MKDMEELICLDMNPALSNHFLESTRNLEKGNRAVDVILTERVGE
jgi:hypothetical protein